jgi:hypothetical protein
VARRGARKRGGDKGKEPGKEPAKGGGGDDPLAGLDDL